METFAHNIVLLKKQNNSSIKIVEAIRVKAKLINAQQEIEYIYLETETAVMDKTETKTQNMQV